jgi:hypothetical protein
MTQILRRDYQRAQCVALSKVGMTCREILVFSMPQRIQKCIGVNSKCIDY